MELCDKLSKIAREGSQRTLSEQEKSLAMDAATSIVNTLPRGSIWEAEQALMEMKNAIVAPTMSNTTQPQFAKVSVVFSSFLG